MWSVGGDEWDPFEGARILEVASLSLDELDLEVALFIVDREGNNENDIVRV